MLVVTPALAAKCTLSRIAEWPVRPGTGYAVVDGTINGQKIGIMLDTGAGTTMFSRPEAERLGLARRHAARRRFPARASSADRAQPTQAVLRIRKRHRVSDDIASAVREPSEIERGFRR